MRNICSIEGCNNLVKYKGLSPNKTTRYYLKICSTHYRRERLARKGHIVLPLRERIRCGNNKDKLRLKFLGSPCSICGWKEDRCDLHRVVEGKHGGKYNINNIRILCPNCHRLVHSKKIILY